MKPKSAGATGVVGRLLAVGGAAFLLSAATPDKAEAQFMGQAVFNPCFGVRVPIARMRMIQPYGYYNFGYYGYLNAGYYMPGSRMVAVGDQRPVNEAGPVTRQEINIHIYYSQPGQVGQAGQAQAVQVPTAAQSTTEQPVLRDNTFYDRYNVICKIQYDDEAIRYMEKIRDVADRTDLVPYNLSTDAVGYRNKRNDVVLRIKLPENPFMNENEFIGYLNNALLSSGIFTESTINGISRKPSDYNCNQ
jgi:hypothetical protein